MAKIFNLHKGTAIGEISGEDLAALKARLGRAKRSGADYTLSKDSVESLKGDPTAGDRLYQFFSGALGEDGKLEIGVSDDSARPFQVKGRLLDKGSPCACCKIEAYDEHPVADAWLGSAYTSDDGSFLLGFDDKNFRGDTALLLMISRWDNGDFRELLRLKPKVTGKELSLGDVDLTD
ncbi:MAG: hypothetical protein HY059_10040 [Proteobacteria bacterium]|nr:hypothetical protein [Pseudomonadota bacterium]